MDTFTYATALARLAERYKGWTVDFEEGTDPDHGYAVGGHPELPEHRITRWRDRHGPVVLAQIDQYLARIAESGERVSGGWVDGEDLVLDAPTIVTDYDRAVALGRERGEDAIYCLHTGETITL